MARPRKGVTLSNLLSVDRYFSLALKDNRLFPAKAAKNIDLLYQAKEAYQKLPAIDWKSDSQKKMTMLTRQSALQAWVDEHVTPAKWQRCLLTLRQNKSRKKLKLRRLDLPLEVYLTVKALALKQEKSLSETIYHLAKPAFEKLSKKEYESELGLSKKSSRNIKVTG